MNLENNYSTFRFFFSHNVNWWLQNWGSIIEITITCRSSSHCGKFCFLISSGRYRPETLSNRFRFSIAEKSISAMQIPPYFREEKATRSNIKVTGVIQTVIARVFASSFTVTILQDKVSNILYVLKVRHYVWFTHL